MKGGQYTYIIALLWFIVSHVATGFMHGLALVIAALYMALSIIDDFLGR